LVEREGMDNRRKKIEGIRKEKGQKMRKKMDKGEKKEKRVPRPHMGQTLTG